MTFAALLLGYGLNADSEIASIMGILTFVCAFSVGLGPITWVVMSEVLPKHATTSAGAIGIGCNWTVAFVMVSGLRTCPFVVDGMLLGVEFPPVAGVVERGQSRRGGERILPRRSVVRGGILRNAGSLRIV